MVTEILSVYPLEIRAPGGQDSGSQADPHRHGLQLREPLHLQGRPHDAGHARGPLHVLQAVQGKRELSFVG